VLKRRFGIDDEYVEDLKADLIDAKRVATDEDGKVLVWVGAAPVSGSSLQVSGSKDEDQKQETRNEKPLVSAQPPVSYTPAHLAERIRAEQAALEARGSTDGERKTC
jgi:hypothetical protein